jgi:hypothetical protein
MVGVGCQRCPAILSDAGSMPLLAASWHSNLDWASSSSSGHQHQHLSLSLSHSSLIFPSPLSSLSSLLPPATHPEPNHSSIASSLTQSISHPFSPSLAPGAHSRRKDSSRTRQPARPLPLAHISPSRRALFSSSLSPLQLHHQRSPVDPGDRTIAQFTSPSTSTIHEQRRR